MKKFKAFTLAEVMIVLTVIGVLAGILIPVANNARPDEKVMKFKKAHATLSNAIHELVTSDKYYAEGDLSIKADGSIVDTYDYLCNTIADVISVKEQHCSEINAAYPNAKVSFLNLYNDNMYGVWGKTMSKAIDDSCRYADAGKLKEIIMADGILLYQVWPNSTFGMKHNDGHLIFRELTDKGFLQNYAVLCIDIDGTPANATENDCVNECPFGYGLRADGKLWLGDRAKEWLEKDFQKGKNDN